MGMLKLAAGVAAGYVIGAWAGRDKYEKIAATARKVSAHPTVVQTQEKAKALISEKAAEVRPEPATPEPAYTRPSPSPVSPGARSPRVPVVAEPPL
jgi:membrane carboxypeptidase/penicillin-binding protein PbpC